ncbi:hypothetical protein [Aquicoccus sp. SU-CL01552]|uniref:hypothetical protein n=1 Tax=Aquicoccus sp. SU-CL01552 TaxID=3127656 RepID=UPI003106FDFA
MTLLDLARGPGLYWSVIIMITGLVWRLSTVLLMPYRRNLSAPGARAKGSLRGALTTIVTRTSPYRSFRSRTMPALMLSYTFHFGLLIILLGGAPHILLMKTATGLGWPPLPKGIISLASGLTLAALILVAIRRLRHPVLRLLSNLDDYFSLGLTILPVLSGLLLAEETYVSYELLLAIHILSVEALLIWLPFGKLAHVVLVVAGRAAQGAKFGHKGAIT